VLVIQQVVGLEQLQVLLLKIVSLAGLEEFALLVEPVLAVEH
jgi:hypothetical protein